MNEYSDIIENWLSENPEITLSRVVNTWGSSPRPRGSVMLVNHTGEMAGSVSGGCVEGAVVKKSLALKDTAERLSFGVSNEEAWAVGLSCGGRIQIFTQKADFKADPVWRGLLDAVKDNRSALVVSSLEDGANINALWTEDSGWTGDTVSEEVKENALQQYKKRANQVLNFGDMEYFIHLFPRKPLLIAVGAAHITVDLVRLGNLFGFETVVVDPRGYFTVKTVFSDPPNSIHEAYPSEVLNDYPLDAYTFCAVLSHDPKIDDDALEILLPSEVAYIGALGSRKTHEKRLARLRQKGISDQLLNRIDAPIGLSFRANTAREIALSIIGQIIAVKNANT